MPGLFLYSKAVGPLLAEPPRPEDDEVQRQHTRDHARLLREANAHMRSLRHGGTPAVVAVVEARVAVWDRVAAVLEACAETDNPLEGAAILCEMQAFQETPGTPSANAWSDMAEALRWQLDLLTPLR
jgi:hypothetical protein